MDSTELAKKMLEWESLKKQVDSLGKEIEAEVLKLGKTQTVGKCRVTYSGGRSTYDYETPAKNAPKEIIAKYSTEHKTVNWEGVVELAKVDPDLIEEMTMTTVSVDYKSVCKEAKIDPIVVSKTEPTATIKLLDEKDVAVETPVVKIINNDEPPF
jgi:N-methylhydantoinase A/oxoprolinase/acetone carboxylase beta subunit